MVLVGLGSVLLVNYKRERSDIPLSVTGVPSLATDEVAARLPVHPVAAAIEVLVGDGRGTIGPPRIVVATVLAGAAWSTLLALLSWRSDGASGGQGREGDLSELDHCVLLRRVDEEGLGIRESVVRVVRERDL